MRYFYRGYTYFGIEFDWSRWYWDWSQPTEAFTVSIGPLYLRFGKL